MNETKHMHRKVILLFLMFQLIIMSSVPLFAVSNEGTEEINLVKYRELVIKNNTELKDLKKQRNDYGNALAVFDDNYGWILYGGDQSSGDKAQRKGHYYEYAYPNFVKMVSLEASLTTMDVSIQKFETTLSYEADKLYFQRELLAKQIEIYNQMVETAKKSDDAIALKYELGVASKIDADTSKINLENTIYNRDKLRYTLKKIEYAMQSLAALAPDKTYQYGPTEFIVKSFDSSKFYEYFESAKKSNQALNAAHVTMEALENEKFYINAYKNYVISSDLLDFDRRYEEGQYNIIKAEKDVYQVLKADLDAYNKAEDNINVAKAQLKYDEGMLDKLKEMEKLGQIIDTQRMQYEAKVLTSKLSLLSLENDRNLVLQKLELLVDYGVNL